ncbi:aspartic proteinase nepenthesin-1-like [Panicum hallii]|uniref:aspartic proteinase nepenthesin-1-like n=1 Tax=Panicum hallii TaxID=206008 RepID=UPI000DF4D4BE|nr:aspartic proteinase nepenthesin-1-like [Panicum hallii]
MAAKIALLALMVSFLLAASPAAHGHVERRSFRATMIRRTETAAINFTQAARQSHHRLSMLASRLNTASSHVTGQTPLRMDGDGGAYDMEFSIGTPRQSLTALADTGSDLIWTKCGACASCAPQGSPSYYPDRSSTFSKLPCSDRLCGALKSEKLATCPASGAECDYTYSYGLEASDTFTQGYLASETITLGGAAMPGVGFGCTNVSEGEYGRSSSGLVGLGRGPLSLVSQLEAGAFSYCLTSDTSKASPLLFGSAASLLGNGVQSTGLLTSTSSTFYTVNLERISIGSSTTPGTNDGVVFDSGTTLTFLSEPAYSQAKAEVLSQTNLARAADRDGFEACFDQYSGGDPAAAVPAMVLHFDGGADMALQVRNYFVDVGDGVACWVVQRSPSLSIIGNIMQMDFHVRYDVDNSVLSFQPADCESLQGNAASASAPLVAKFQGIVLLAALHLIFCMLCSS